MVTIWAMFLFLGTVAPIDLDSLNALCVFHEGAMLDVTPSTMRKNGKVYYGVDISCNLYPSPEPRPEEEKIRL